MEAQDHRKPKLSGHEGHSGSIHVCQKCGWPFPKPHPSAKQRRTHKKVCGTIEGYKLDDDDNDNDAQDKTALFMTEGSNGEHVSDDERDKTPSGKAVDVAIGRRSSSGVGSRSGRSNRSEDEVFADAATDFTDGSGHGEASDGGLQRFYSMQNANESDLNYAKRTAEDDDSVDKLCAPSILPKDHQNQVQTVQKLESENDRVEAGILSKDETSSSTFGSAMVSASVTVDNENKAEQDMEQSSITSCIVDDESKDVSSEASSRDVRVMRALNEEIFDPASAGEIVKSTGMETNISVSENNIECSEAVDAPGNLHSLELPDEVLDPANGSTSKLSDVEVHGSKTGASEDVNVQAVSDALPLHKHPEILVEGLDNRGEIDNFKVPGSATENESLEGGIAHAAEVCSGIDLTEAGDGKKICSEDDVLSSVDAMENNLKQDVGQKSIVEQSTVAEPGQISYPEARKISSEVVPDFKIEGLQDKQVSCGEEPKPILSLDNVFPEGAAADNLKFTSNGAANTSNYIKGNTENLVVQEIDKGEVSVLELPGSALWTERPINDISPQVEELSNLHDSNDTGSEENIGVVQNQSHGNEMTSGGKDNEVVDAETAFGCRLGAAGSRDSIQESLEPERINDHGKSDKMVNSGDVMVGCSLPMVESTGEAECIGEDAPVAILKTGDLPGSISSNASEVCEDAQFSLQSSAAVNDTCTKRSAEEAFGVVEGEKISKQQVAVSAVDVLPDSSSQTDSLEGNWGSVSVMSTVSDTPPGADTPASDHGQVSAAEENANVAPKSVTESQHSESKISIEQHAELSNMEGISEIQTLEEQQQKGSALQTAWSSSVGHVENVPLGGKKDEEIIAKVTNWSTEKNHTPLKTLLGEATARSRAESPVHHNQSSNPVPKTDEIPVAANNGFSKTEKVILSSNNPTAEEMGKEWNSPARYPVNIKTEKRRTKGRAYWAPFLCCSSVNAR